MSTRRFKAIPSFTYSGKGFVSCRDGVASIALTDQTENRSIAFAVADGTVEVATRNIREERLKATERDEADVLQVFADGFVEAQRRIIPRNRQALEEGDKVTITGIHEDEKGVLWCKPVGADEEMVLFDDDLVAGTYVRDLFPYLYENDFIKRARVETDAEGLGISIREAYLAFAIQNAQVANRNRHFFRGRVLDIDEDRKRIYWMTACGFFGISRIREGLGPGHEAVLYVVNVQFRDQDVFINVDVDEAGGAGNAVQPFDEEKLLEGFIQDAPPAGPETKSDGEMQARELAEILGSAHPIGSLEKYRTLLAARFLAEAVQDRESAAEYARRAEILQRKLLYAQGKVVRTLDGAPAEIACLYPTADPVSFLGETGIAGRVARLLTVAKVAREEPETVPVKDDTIRRRVCALLGVDDAFRPSRTHVTGKYGGEGNEVEFKSSYVMRNDGGGPDLDYQGRGQVFEAVCGFLNANGGVLFLGVNDSGDPVTDPGRGLQGDMDWFIANYARVNARGKRLLGHPVPMADTIDHFVLFLQQEKIVYIKDTLQDNITIEATEDQDAIRITVKPSEYEIAYLYRDCTRADGVAYVRDGNQTLPMSEEAKRRRLMTLKRVDKEIGHLVKLQEAIDGKHKVILRDYASGNSGEVRDRTVVPINLFYDDEKVWCYDLEDRNFKQFNLSRIGEVDTDIPDPEYNHDFRPCEADIFSWVDKDHDYPIRLRMEVRAYNYLVETYAGARKLPDTELYREDDSHWILDTTVHGLAPLRWFYLILADKIEILDSPAAEALKEEVRTFVREYLPTD